MKQEINFLGEPSASVCSSVHGNEEESDHKPVGALLSISNQNCENDLRHLCPLYDGGFDSGC